VVGCTCTARRNERSHNESRCRKTQPRKLGLSIVAAVAQAHGGTAVARPTPGGGATFVVAIPLAR
jgi:two-component system OmpR family sensor kinase